MSAQKNILVAPVFWGLGHATRCIPIIRQLLNFNFNVILASDDAALHLLQKEFPNLEAIELPGYHIRYPKKGYFFKLKLISQLSTILKSVRQEHKKLKEFLEEKNIHGIISDGRLGLYSDKFPSVYVTHQLQLYTGKTTFISSWYHRKLMEKFDAIWIPDSINPVVGLSGKLGHPKKLPENAKYIGPLSRFHKRDLPKTIDYLVILSGPEPQRSMLEKVMIKELQDSAKKIVLVQGKIEAEQTRRKIGNIEIVNYMSSEELEQNLNQCEYVISRSGYSTIMDLARLEKKAFFIPTPGQYEQLYLSKRLKHLGLVYSCQQHEFKAEKLKNLTVYKGLSAPIEAVDFENLFQIFN